MHAIRQQLDGFVRADLLIEAAVRAVALGVESPSLYELAGLARREGPEVQEVFRRVTDELQIASSDLAEGRWELVHWWCGEIVGGRLRPEVGGRMIWSEGWEKLGYPESLRPIIGSVSEWEDWSADWGIEREELERTAD